MVSLRANPLYSNPPNDAYVTIVAEDGTEISPSTGGTFGLEWEQTWTYDVTGLARVGFSMDSTQLCSAGWTAAPIIVESVFAQ